MESSLVEGTLQQPRHYPLFQLPDGLRFLPRGEFCPNLPHSPEHPIRPQLHPNIEGLSEHTTGFSYLPGEDIGLSKIGQGKRPTLACP